jgi:hypothetical protein
VERRFARFAPTTLSDDTDARSEALRYVGRCDRSAAGTIKLSCRADGKTFIWRETGTAAPVSLSYSFGKINV